MSSTQASTDTKAASRTYRIKSLKRARIFVNQLDRDHWPDAIRDLAGYLSHNNFTHTLTSQEVSQWCRYVLADPLMLQNNRMPAL